ncbi:type II secretion system protein GspM [Ottowia testudinis]|uniref:General secretion pathway protein GspM n=1 Tax=Ottowia testudinis TaxID=2816950 RepID=A0A975H3A1_9BURK|nr:type II secretion system protein GspM [Ottowia testudinis]QTD45045.1 general secretion pathway protein GspM [Ottowia testudinis]
MAWRNINLHPWSRRALLTLVAAALLVLIGCALIYRAMWSRYGAGLDQLESRIERLDGVLQSGADIQGRLAAARRQVQPWLYPGGDSAQNDVTQRLRELVVAAECTLVSSQAAAVAGEDGKLSRIRLSATVTGDWAQLLQLLERLQSQQPPLWTSSVNLMREGGNTPNAPQKARLGLQLEATLAPGKGVAP